MKGIVWYVPGIGKVVVLVLVGKNGGRWGKGKEEEKSTFVLGLGGGLGA